MMRFKAIFYLYKKIKSYEYFCRSKERFLFFRFIFILFFKPLLIYKLHALKEGMIFKKELKMLDFKTIFHLLRKIK